MAVSNLLAHANKNLDAARDALVRDAGSGKDYLQLTSKVNEIARIEGQASVYSYAVDMAGREVPVEVQRVALLKGLLNGPDDEWSGRKNDARRCYTDGRREAIREVLDQFDYAL